MYEYRKENSAQGKELHPCFCPFFNCFSSPKQFQDIIGATASVVENCMSNFSLKVLAEVIENVHVIFPPKFPAHFDITVREMSYRKCLSTDERTKEFLWFE